jgi:UDP-N-acetylglucosamine 1-carboxyvinyltransferase
VEIDSTNAGWDGAPYERMRRIRASYYFIGSMLGRFGKAKTTMPGGCNFGVRPIDQHVKGMTALGAEVDVKSGYILGDTHGQRLRGAHIYLDKVSVGATMNIIIAACMAEGRTIIENAAREPHIVDLANFLNSMGADIRGAGTDVIKILGVDYLSGTSYSIIPDQIEAGTYMAAAVATRGDVTIRNVIPKHLESITAKLQEMGATVEEGAQVHYSIVMPGAVIKKGAVVKYAIVAENTVVEEGAQIGQAPEEMENRDDWGVALVGDNLTIGKNAVIGAKKMVEDDVKEGEVR